MKSFHGQALRWEWRDGVIELTLDRPPANEIGTIMLGELEQFVEATKRLAEETSVCIITSVQKSGFCAGADLRELYHAAFAVAERARISGVRDFLERIHAVLKWLDEA